MTEKWKVRVATSATFCGALVVAGFLFGLLGMWLHIDGGVMGAATGLATIGATAAVRHHFELTHRPR